LNGEATIGTASFAAVPTAAAAAAAAAASTSSVSLSLCLFFADIFLMIETS
jgi:hypothetical protein